jgi:hypothetical protein
MVAVKASFRAALPGSFLLLLFVSVVGVPKSLGEPAPYLVEMALYVLGSVLAIRATRRRLAAASSDVWPLRIAASLILALAVGQAIRVRKAYPLMPYTMYGRAREGAATFYQYRAHHSSGRQSSFRPSNVISTLGNGRFVRGLAERLGSPREADHDLVRRALGVLIGSYNAEHRDDPIVAVEVEQVVLPPPFRSAGATRTPVMRVAAEPVP